MREPILKYYDLGLNVTAFSSTRHGGESTDNYASFNINPYCGDNPQNVLQNKESLCRKLGLKPRDLILPHQTHGTTVRLIDQVFLQKSESERMSNLISDLLDLAKLEDGANKERIAVTEVTIEVENLEQLNDVLKAIRKVDSVYEVRRKKGDK
mgnify:CR=1 FL=1